MFFSFSTSTYLGECGPGDQHGTHLALGKEEGIAHHHACHEVRHMRELVGSAAVPHSIDAAIGCLQLVTHLSASSQISGCITRSVGIAWLLCTKMHTKTVICISMTVL